MMKMSNKVELLAPAGNFEKLEMAIHYGADAVYLAGKNFSLRNFSGNFEPDQLQLAIDFWRCFLIIREMITGIAGHLVGDVFS